MITTTSTHVLIPQRTRKNPFHTPLVTRKNKPHLLMDPTRSKLAAGILNGLATYPQPDDTILYLGASAGYTVSFLAQMHPLIMAVEVSPIMCRDLVLISRELGTIAPILADARDPLTYAHRVIPAHYLFQDISQPDQLDIFIRSADTFLRPDGRAVLTLKTRSISAVDAPADIFKNVLDALSTKYRVIEHHSLTPYQKDHYLIAITHK